MKVSKLVSATQTRKAGPLYPTKEDLFLGDIAKQLQAMVKAVERMSNQASKFKLPYAKYTAPLGQRLSKLTGPLESAIQDANKNRDALREHANKAAQ